MQATFARHIEQLIGSIQVLLVEDNAHMRKVIRSLLTHLGVKTIHEAADGQSGLDAIRTVGPDLVVLDWEMPVLDGAQVVRAVRSPKTFPVPDVPIIMLTGHVERWRVLEAARIGVNEMLRKPVSGKALYDQIVAVLAKPRPMVHLGDYYGPEPRNLFYEPA